MTNLKCIVCKEPAIGVCSSICGVPMSHAYCQECISLRREDWGTLLARGFSLTRETAADWFHDLIMTSCAYYGKTEGEYWAEVKQLEKDYENEMSTKRP